MASGRTNKNHIGSLLLENVAYMSNSKEIEEEILRSFSSLYSPMIKEKSFMEGIDWSPCL